MSSVNIQSIALKRLLESQSVDFYNKLTNKYFDNTNLVIFSYIRKFYEQRMRMPSTLELSESIHNPNVKHYLENEVLNQSDPPIESTFIADLLQDYFIREETIQWLDTFIDRLETLERTEIIDAVQQHALDLYQFLPDGEELFDVAQLESFPEDDSFTMYPSGLSAEYDSINGGFGLQELIMFGGRRGSGKSIVTLNTARHQFTQNNNSVAFMSIEMRYVEVYFRLMSMLSGVPFMRFMRKQLTEEDKLQVAKTKLDTFYSESEEKERVLKRLLENKDFREFDVTLKNKKVPFKDKRFHIIDDVNLSVPKIDHYLNMLTKKYNIKACVVDYLNIIKIEDRMNWQSQISLADSLKTLSRKYEVMLISPYQIDASGEARFAKGVLDSADRSFRFSPADLNDNPDVLPFEIAKIRNGKSMKFDVHMDWECLRVVPEKSQVVSGKILNKYGDDSKEQGRDLG